MVTKHSLLLTFVYIYIYTWSIQIFASVNLQMLLPTCYFYSLLFDTAYGLPHLTGSTPHILTLAGLIPHSPYTYIYTYCIYCVYNVYILYINKTDIKQDNKAVDGTMRDHGQAKISPTCTKLKRWLQSDTRRGNGCCTWPVVAPVCPHSQPIVKRWYIINN